MEPNILERIFDGSIQPRDITLSALQSITENFSEERIIGEGGFGSVYKGVLLNGEVAVKRIHNRHTIDEKLFHREVNSLLIVNHRNIVRFLGFCSHTVHRPFKQEGSGEFILFEDRERILCFEYINNGSLERYIADELRGLQWDTRYSIIKGICQGLQYLHMEKSIMHMDLKPANILIDGNMVAKITDFGLSRMVENSQTKTANRFLSPGYSAPEYIDSGTMSPSYDVYSLGIIIIQVLTGQRSIPNTNNVLRRWNHRLHKSGEATPFRYQQIAKLIEIGLLCQSKDSCKRPFISDIIRVISELESTDSQVSNAYESTVGQISSYLEDDMLAIEPLELRLPFELNTKVSCSLELANETNASIAFSIHKTTLLPYCIQPNKGIVAPRSKYSVNITLQPIDRVPQDKLTGDFIVRSTKVNDSLKSEDITEDIFNIEEGQLVDEVNLTVTYKAEVPQVHVSLGSLKISDTRNLHGPQESSVQPTEEESKISASTSDEVIQFDPPELCFPLVPDKKVLSSVKLINITEFYVSIMVAYSNKNSANYSAKESGSILPPRSTQWLTVTREEKEDAVKDIQFNDEAYVGYAIVDEDMNASDLDWEDYDEHKKLPIVLTETKSCASKELIQFDPPELSFPCLNKTALSSVNIVNLTDCYIGFNTWHFIKNDANYDGEPRQGILAPRSTQRMVVKRMPKNEEPEDLQCKNNLFMWNMIVAEGFKASNFCHYRSDEDSKEIPLNSKKIRPCISDELIRLDYPGLHFTFSQNKTSLSSINMVNVSDYYVGFRVFNSDANAVCYHTDPRSGILTPRSAQRLVVARVVNEMKPDDMQYNDKLFMWNAIVTSSTLVEMIKFEPPEVCFPFLPRKSMLSSMKIVNITDYHVGFSTHVEETNVAMYITEPPYGVLPPWSTQELVVTRVAKEETPDLEDMQSNDKYFVWSCFVTEDVNAGDLTRYMHETERKELPIVFNETSSSTSDEPIQFDPPELHFPFLPNKKVSTSVKIVNLTDYNVGFNAYSRPTNAAWYHTEPPRGIVPPRSTQKLMVTREEKEGALKDKQIDDKYFVWKSIVSEGVKESDLSDYRADQESMELPIVLDKICSSIPDELIQLDPAELCIPFLLKNTMLLRVNIVNTTDFFVAFDAYWIERNAPWNKRSMKKGILPPRSTEKYIFSWTTTESEGEHMECTEDFFVWNRVVTEHVESGDIISYMGEEESMKLPLILSMANPFTANELIQFDPPELSLPFMPNKPLVFAVNIVNSTDYCVGFYSCNLVRNMGRFYIKPDGGVMQPRSTQRLVVKRVPQKKEHEHMHCEYECFIWSRLVSEGVEASDFVGRITYEESKKLPIAYKKSLCTSDELIQFDPPELHFPFLPNKRVSMLRKFKIANVTDHSIGFSIWAHEDNSASYVMEPHAGILPPQSTQAIKVRRTLNENETEDMQCKDKIFVWNGIVTEGVEVSDVGIYWKDEDKELCVFLTKHGESSSR